MPRRDLTLAEKIAVLDKIKKQPDASFRQLAKITRVPKSTIERLVKRKDQLRQEWDLLDEQGASRKRKRAGKDPAVDEALHAWYANVNEKKLYVSGSMLKTKSEQLAIKLGHADFKATSGWLSRWKDRHGVKLKNREESASVKSYILCYDEKAINEDGIVEKIKAKYHKASEDKEKEEVEVEDNEVDKTTIIGEKIEKTMLEDDGVDKIAFKGEEVDTPKREFVTNQEAKLSTALLRLHFSKESNEDSPVSASETCAE